MQHEKIEVVAFAQELVKRQHCPFCNEKFSLSDVSAQGTRRDKSGKSCYFYETHCGGCGQPSMTVVTSRPMDTRGLMGVLAEYYTKKDESGTATPEEGDGSPKAAQPPKSGITDEEVERARKMLDKAKTFDDVMKGLGMSGEVIERYMREGGEQDADEKGK